MKHLCHLSRACEAPPLFAEVLNKIQLGETFDKPPGHRKRGRPRKDIDPLIVIHMISNRAQAADVAEFLGVHRDTIYASHREAFDEGRRLFYKKWRVISDEMFQDFLKKRKMKEELRKKKQKDYRAMYYQKHSK